MPRNSTAVSKNMSKIHSQDTSIELLLRKALWHKGYRYRKNYKALPGSPDIVLTKFKIAIFCDSEFFHGKDWEILKLRLEKGKNPDYWIKKIERNRTRDWENDRKLLFLGYTVIHFWGQDIIKHTNECIQTIEESILDIKISNNIIDAEECKSSFFNSRKNLYRYKYRKTYGCKSRIVIKENGDNAQDTLLYYVFAKIYHIE